MAEQTELNELQLAKGDAEVIRMYMEGLSPRDIARRNKIRIDLYYEIINQARAELLEQTHTDLGVLIAEQTAAVRQVMSEAWEAWRRSQTPSERTITEQSKATLMGNDISPEKVRVVVQADKNFGDPRFLDTILKCHERLSKLRGMDAAIKLKVEGTLGPQKHQTPLERMSDAELQRMVTEAYPPLPVKALPVREVIDQEDPATDKPSLADQYGYYPGEKPSDDYE